MKYKLILSVLACVLCFCTQAQVIPRNQPNSLTSNKTQDIIYLKDSSVIKGQIIETTPERVKIELLGGSILVYKMSEVVVIKKEIVINPAIIEKKYHRRDTGVYHHVQTKLNVGMRSYGLSGGLGISYSGGYFINKYLGIGLTAGVERIAGYRFVPVLVDFRGYLSDNKTRFYYNLGAGYGFARAGYSIYPSFSASKNIIDGQGGFYINPAIGVQFASPNKHHFTLDLGYSVNQANFTVQTIDFISSGLPIEYMEKNIFYRWVLRAGWTF